MDSSNSLSDRGFVCGSCSIPLDCLSKGLCALGKPNSVGRLPPKSALDVQVGGDHYKTAIQPVEFIHANNLPFIEGTIVKYITRWRKKGGVQDLEKIKHYVDLLIELENRKNERDASPSWQTP